MVIALVCARVAVAQAPCGQVQLERVPVAPNPVALGIDV